MTAAYDPEQLEEKEQTGAGAPAGEPDDLKQTEQNGGGSPHENQVGEGYKTGADLSQMKPTPTGIIKFAKNNRGKIIVGSGISAGFIALLIAGFLFILPLKILHIVNNLQSRFYSTAENAVDKEVDQLFSNYIKRKIKLGGCKQGFINSSCQQFTASDSLVTRLYKGWSNGRLEEKLWEKNGIRVKIKNDAGKRTYELQLKKQNVGVELRKDTFIDGNKTIDDVLRTEGSSGPVTRNQVRQAFKDALKNESRYTRVMYRMKVSRLLAAKYGVKLCVVGCFGVDKLIDDFRDKVDDKRNAAKLWLGERVLRPRGEIYQLIFQCVYLPGSCSKERVINASPDPEYSADVNGTQSGGDRGGRSESVVGREIESKLVALWATYGSDRETLRRIFELYEKNGFLSSIFRSFVSSRVDDEGDRKGKDKLGKEKAVEATEAEGNKRGLKVSAVRTLGWVVLGSQIIVFVDDAPSVLDKLQYEMNAATKAQMFALYRTHADELKEGDVEAAITGSFVSSLGPGKQPGGGGEQIGGTAGAEGTPLYQSIIGNAEQKTLFANILAPQASAAEPYICHNGQPVQRGELVCNEDKLFVPGQLSTSLKEFKKTPGWGLLAGSASFLNDTVNGLVGALIDAIPDVITDPIGKILGKITSAAGNLVGKLAGYTGLGDVIKGFLSKLVLGETFFSTSSNMSGGRTFVNIAGGADVSGNEFAHYGIGGRELSSSEVATILHEQGQSQQTKFQQRSFFARIFDKEDPGSAVSRLALAAPSSPGFSTLSSMKSLISNPFSKIGSVFSSLFSQRVGAIPTQVVDDPFGVTQYGYPVDDPVFKEDPDDYWRKYCTTDNPDNLTVLWNQYAADITKNQNLDVAANYAYMPTNKVPGAYPSKAGAKLATLIPGWTGTNGCLLIQAAAGSAGAIFTDEVLSPDEKADTPPQGFTADSSSSASPAGGSGGSSGADTSPTPSPTPNPPACNPGVVDPSCGL
ncbi:hypothetical protein HY379_02700 [Candidatus Saccharibacteria bacterium]|nr:hypothetical protein [Candidatus Saccharibacteria bacterium]